LRFFVKGDSTVVSRLGFSFAELRVPPPTVDTEETLL
jgi:hypothetical protein